MDFGLGEGEASAEPFFLVFAAQRKLRPPFFNRTRCACGRVFDATVSASGIGLAVASGTQPQAPVTSASTFDVRAWLLPLKI